jgi:hypothetical protein
MNNIDFVEKYLKDEHNIVDYSIEHISIGLFVIEFRNRKDRGIKAKKF